MSSRPSMRLAKAALTACSRSSKVNFVIFSIVFFVSLKSTPYMTLVLRRPNSWPNTNVCFSMLTEQQQAALQEVQDAVERVRGGGPPQHFVLEAVAGSGKTRTLTAIVQHLTQRWPESTVLLLQFNQEACMQMKERLRTWNHTSSDDSQIKKTRRCFRTAVWLVHTLHSYATCLLGNPSIDRLVR